MAYQCNTPVALFLFKRIEKTVCVVRQIAKVKPRKLYLIADGARNAEEAAIVEECRRQVESAIDWPCEVIKNYAVENRGVYANIGLGAKWVLERESQAIFLEDDNFPDETFFPYAEEMLRRYERDTRVLWVCGTNYLKQYGDKNSQSYYFTRLMLPCGWASWAHKFLPFYDGNLDFWKRDKISLLNQSYIDKKLLKQDIDNWDREKWRIENNNRPNSWDYQMSFSIRLHNLYGIAPKYNLIKNIGVDMDSIHGGTSMSNIMTRRFCELDTHALEFPLKHPNYVSIDYDFEKSLEQMILYPMIYRIEQNINNFLKTILFIPKQESLTGTIKKRLGIKK